MSVFTKMRIPKWLKCFFKGHDYEIWEGNLEYQKGVREKFYCYGQVSVCKRCGKEIIKVKK